MAVLKAGFLDRLMERCLQIETLMQQIERDGATDHLRGEIAHRAHKTAGVAQTFGYADLGLKAQEVERMWGRDFSPDRLEPCRMETERLMDAMEEILDRDMQSPGRIDEL
ncbi:hypothetical protein HKCCE4037_06130 [Rhodobacterales bacterium HKCCE4037]|nr:hypothetical protein [Rhodobacterales bacterium HKCCE4037]